LTKIKLSLSDFTRHRIGAPRPQFGRAVLQQDQTMSACRNTLRQARSELSRLHPACVNQAMAAR